MSASSRTEHNSAWIRASSPFQKEQNGSSSLSTGEAAWLVSAESLSVAGSVYIKSTSQSAQRVNPCRYSALHCGQNITPRVYYTWHSILDRRSAGPAAASVFFLDLLFAIHYYNGQVNVSLECGVYAGSCRSRGAVLLFSGVFPICCHQPKMRRLESTTYEMQVL